MFSKFIGGLLLIVGTSIGGGMLALPIATASSGLLYTTLALIFCWAVMSFGALLILEVNLRLPSGSNMISMAKETLGPAGQWLAWFTYLFLLYTLLAAYISGGSDVFHGILLHAHFDAPAWLTAFLFTSLFSFVVYSGIRAVDYVNRGLMFGKLGVYVLLVIIITPYVHITKWSGGTLSAVPHSLMILVTSFGFATIVPSLRDYFHSDRALLQKVIVIGSGIPLICYLLWIAVISGVISRDGQNGLVALTTSEHATSHLTQALSFAVHNTFISVCFEFFTSICMLTAFLGVSLGLFDCLADGLKLHKTGRQGKITLALTFIPPLLLVLFKPGIYLHALNYAGICCVVLLLLLPVCMAWRSRAQQPETQRLLPGGKWLLVVLGLTAAVLLRVAYG